MGTLVTDHDHLPVAHEQVGLPAVSAVPNRLGDLRSAFSSILLEHRVIGPVELPFGNFRVACQGCDWRERADFRNQALGVAEGHIVDLLVERAVAEMSGKLANMAGAHRTNADD